MLGILSTPASDVYEQLGGRAVYDHVITKFSGMGRFTYSWCSAGALRAPELRYKSYINRRLVTKEEMGGKQIRAKLVSQE